MIIRRLILLLLGGFLLETGGICAVAANLRLSRASDTFFVEDDQVYVRALWFQKDGTYRQINRDRTISEEVDRGTWEQARSGEVALHPTNGMLSYRALSAGPLLVILGAQGQIDALPVLRAKIAGFLQTYQDEIFESSAAAELAATGASGAEAAHEDGVRVILPEQAETFSRSDLEDLLRSVDLWSRSRSSNTFVFDPAAPAGGSPLLLIQRGAVFSRAGLPTALAQAGSNKAPAFYFAQVSRRIFLRRVGTWKPFDNLGGLHMPALDTKPAP